MSLLSGFITAIFHNWHMNKVIIIIIIITLVDKRPKNRLQFILIVHKKYLES